MFYDSKMCQLVDSYNQAVQNFNLAENELIKRMAIFVVNVAKRELEAEIEQRSIESYMYEKTPY